MTIPQIKGFIAAIGKRKANDAAMSLTNTALGAQGNGKDIKKAVNEYLSRTKES